MMRTRHALALTGIVLLLSGCDLLDSLAAGCTTELRHGLAVSVQDSVTGAWIASGARLTVNGVDYVETSSVPGGRPDLDSFAIPAAGERPGLYVVIVSKDGYFDWVQRGVRVTENECHVRTMRLTARLQPLA